MKKKEFYKVAYQEWGQNFILQMLIEECSELIQAICYFERRQEKSFTKFMEEMADVEILIEQMKVTLGNQIFEYNGLKRRKLNRAIKRLENKSNG